MKKLRVTSCMALVAAAVGLLLAFTACSADIVEELAPQAKLLSLSVTTADGKTIEVSAIPVPIPDTDWDDEDFTVAASDYGVIVARKDENTTGARLNPTVSPGARVAWGKARAGNRPPNFTDPRVPVTFTYQDSLYLRVTADDGITENYYRFYAVLASPVKELAELTISGREAEKVPTEAETMTDLIDFVTGDNSNYYAGVALTVSEAANAVVLPVGQQEGATFRYAVAQTRTNATPAIDPSKVETDYDPAEWENEKYEWRQSNAITFADGNILYLEVTAENEVEKNYYAFQVSAGHMATIAELKLDGVEVVGKGTPHRQWGSVTQGAFSSADQKASGFGVSIQLTDPDSVYAYQVLPSTQTTEPASGWTSPPLARVPSGSWLAIRVRPALSPSVNTPDTRYYKVQVTELAVNFTRQPKSAAYTVMNDPFTAGTRVYITDTTPVTVDKDIESLTVGIDRTGNFNYQWYTANSWYGGYGFDKDGRIVGDPGVVSDSYHDPSKLDEKSNISIHNGGNQFYRLPYGGNPIPGATSASYTPTISAKNRPFLSGFSNQTQYYWVVISDSAGLKATSQRAAIVTEWGRTWNIGRPTADTVEKKHYIMDLYAYTDNPKRSEGLQGAPRNPTPFIDGNHRDRYIIPIKLPAGFNIMDYSIVTCQAKFYLADGREWIQNWTQGDFGFDQTNGERVIWYNLTNDNATRALSNSGNEPVGGGLTSNPTDLVVQPAGTKPLKQMPPFTTDLDEEGRFKPAANNDAQGWFTPYIEIVELRFEGPAR